MARFYRGAGIGTYWYVNDARLAGFAPHKPGATPSLDSLMYHIARASTASPYISFTRSFGVAHAYAIWGSGGRATPGKPGYVYEIEVSDDSLCVLEDPVKEIANDLPVAWQDPSYQHDGDQRFLLGVVSPTTMRHFLQARCKFPPGSAATPRPPNLTVQVESLVRALRDAEVLVRGNVPASVVRNRYDVY